MQATIPLRAGSKLPAVSWKGVGPGETVPDVPGSQGRALLTGARSGGVVVVDVDVKDGGFDRLSQLETFLGALPPTRSVRTASGGLHLYFKSPVKLRSVARVSVQGCPPNTRQTPEGKTEPLDGVDIRGEGGIVVLPDPVRGSVVEEDLPIATLPDRWAANLPRYRGETSEPVQVTPVSVDLSTLRQRLADTAKGRRGAGWEAMRLAAKGERMISIEGGPAGGPLVHGVDDFLSKQVIFALAGCELDGWAWYTADPEEIGALFEPSLAILRSDVESTGGSSKFSAEHFASKWPAAASKIASQVQESLALSFGLETSKAEAEEKRAAQTPLLVQLEDKFFVLDDRDRLVYEGPHCSQAVRGIAQKLWPGRVLDVDSEKGVRPMTPQDIMAAYAGEACGRLATEYSASSPRVEDLTLVKCLARPPVDAKEDAEVHAWLVKLGGDRLLDWIAWAAPEKCDATVPALALIGASAVGKSLLAESLALAAGQAAASGLKAVLGRFRFLLDSGPIVFGDEGLPKVEGQPATEEFRSLVTAPVHLIELKGLDKRLEVRGGVRVILAANRADRLFSNTGQLGAHDVSAIIRRLVVIDVEGSDHVETLKKMSASLGAFEGDPARRLRVAQHLRHIQVTRDCAQPEPYGGTLGAALRKGSDLASLSLQALEDGIDQGAPWVGVTGSSVWLHTDGLVTRLENKHTAQALLRALSPYVEGKSVPVRVHPVTGAALEKRTRWTELDLTRLRADGIDCGPSK